MADQKRNRKKSTGGSNKKDLTKPVIDSMNAQFKLIAPFMVNYRKAMALKADPTNSGTAVDPKEADQ